jgi:hypothetical protein
MRGSAPDRTLRRSGSGGTASVGGVAMPTEAARPCGRPKLSLLERIDGEDAQRDR